MHMVRIYLYYADVVQIVKIPRHLLQAIHNSHPQLQLVYMTSKITALLMHEIRIQDPVLTQIIFCKRQHRFDRCLSPVKPGLNIPADFPQLLLRQRRISIAKSYAAAPLRSLHLMTNRRNISPFIHSLLTAIIHRQI